VSSSDEKTPAAPMPLMGMAALMRMLFAGTDLGPVGQALINRAEADPNDANALMDMATVLELNGNPQLAEGVQWQALQMQQHFRLPAEHEGLRLLALMAPGEMMANTPLEFLVAGSDVTLEMLYLVPGQAIPTALPEQDLVFVAIGESDRNRVLLEAVPQVLAQTDRPVLNRAERIARLSRDGASALLQSVDGVAMPATVRLDRQSLLRVARGECGVDELLADGGFPLIIRPVGSHAGRRLTRLEDAAALAAYLEEDETERFFLSRFVDYRSADGLYRKYRVMFVDGRPFLAHMAISDHWMVHYLNAGMAEHPERREEEARTMDGFDEGLAARHGETLAAIARRVELEYFGIDCAETPEGELLIFEADSALVVHDLDPPDLYPYKSAHMRRLFDAFRELLGRRAA